MKIKQISVSNFMRIGDRVNIGLGPVTVIVGSNGSGKSSFLKAIHWSVRCATLKDRNNNTSLENMDYTPSKEYLQLGHKKRIQNGESSEKICVHFLNDHDQETTITINAARNDAGAKSRIDGVMAESLLSESPQTAYIPGLAGLAETETLLATPVLHRRAASGVGGSVLRHILLELVGGSEGTGNDFKELKELGNWVGKVIPDVQFWVKFDRLRDINIKAEFLMPDMLSEGGNRAQSRKPLEMAGTGFLQIVQIFAYLLKFKPKLLLIDEPDAHLHPGTQELLINTIEEAADYFPETQFILTTHSPSLVRSCSETTRVWWMDQGKVKLEDENAVRQRMGWGALDKEVILFTEDEKTTYLKSIIAQWPHIDRKVLIWPTFGSSGLPHGSALTKLRSSLGVAVMVHRDRDFMSESDVAAWVEKRGYVEHQIPFWLPQSSDIEAEFCNAHHISEILSISTDDAEQLLEEAVHLNDRSEVERDFNTALHGAINSLPSDIRSIPTARWRDMGEYNALTIKGKSLIESIKIAAKNHFVGTADARKIGLLKNLVRPTKEYPIALSLKDVLETAIDGNITLPPSDNHGISKKSPSITE